MRLEVGIVAAVLAVASRAAAFDREPLVFVGDPKLGVEPSVRTFDSLGRLAFRYEDVLPTETIEDSSLLGRAVRAIGRGLKLVFLDEPIAELNATVVHEVGGHGARGREFDLRPTYHFFLPGIYRLLFAARDESDVGAFTAFITSGIVDEPREIITTLGGLEANYVHAWWINARIVRAHGEVHHGDLLVYGVSKLTYASSFFSPSLQRLRVGSNDIESYVTGLQEFSNGWRAEDRRSIARRLGAGYLWNLADPTLLYSFYATLVSTLFHGERISQMPLPTVGGLTMLLSPRYGLTPFGAEQVLDAFLANEQGTMLGVYARVGTSGLASYYGAGARVLGIPIRDRITLGAELDVWRQPEIVRDERGLFDAPRRMGINAGLYGELRITDLVSITGKLSGKTAGYVSGLPIAGGPHGYAGLSLAW